MARTDLNEWVLDKSNVYIQDQQAVIGDCLIEIDPQMRMADIVKTTTNLIRSPKFKARRPWLSLKISVNFKR